MSTTENTNQTSRGAADRSVGQAPDTIPDLKADGSSEPDKPRKLEAREMSIAEIAQITDLSEDEIREL